MKTNKATFKAQQQALIDRTAPYDGNPLIQKAEDDEVRDQGIDNQVYQVATESAINNPSSLITADFETVDQYNIDTTSSIPSTFTILSSNLEVNSVGKVNITKRSADTFVFGNATLLPYNDLDGQVGKTSLQFNVMKVGSSFFVIPLFAPEFKKMEIESSAQLLIKELPATIWDMNADPTIDTRIDIPHGLSIAKIRSVSVLVFRTDGLFAYDLMYGNPDVFDELSGGYEVGTTNIQLTRKANRVFTGTQYTAATIHVLVTYSE